MSVLKTVRVLLSLSLLIAIGCAKKTTKGLPEEKIFLKTEATVSSGKTLCSVQIFDESPASSSLELAEGESLKCQGMALRFGAGTQGPVYSAEVNAKIGETIDVVYARGPETTYTSQVTIPEPVQFALRPTNWKMGTPLLIEWDKSPVKADRLRTLFVFAKGPNESIEVQPEEQSPEIGKLFFEDALFEELQTQSGHKPVELTLSRVRPGTVDGKISGLAEGQNIQIFSLFYVDPNLTPPSSSTR